MQQYFSHAGTLKRERGHIRIPHPHPNIPQLKQSSYCHQANYDRAISLTVAVESARPFFQHM